MPMHKFFPMLGLDSGRAITQSLLATLCNNKVTDLDSADATILSLMNLVLAFRAL